jgi:hypothetical protein
MTIKKIINNQKEFLKTYFKGNPPPPRNFEVENKKYTLIKLSDNIDIDTIIQDQNGNIINLENLFGKLFIWDIKSFDYLDQYISGELNFLELLIERKCQYAKLMSIFGNTYLVRLSISDEKINDYHISVFDDLTKSITKNQFYYKYPKAINWLRKYLVYKIRKSIKNR